MRRKWASMWSRAQDTARTRVSHSLFALLRCDVARYGSLIGSREPVWYDIYEGWQVSGQALHAKESPKQQRVKSKRHASCSLNRAALSRRRILLSHDIIQFRIASSSNKYTLTRRREARVTVTPKKKKREANNKSDNEENALEIQIILWTHFMKFL
jgi:hypothetical protein